MARSDLLINLVKASSRGDQSLFKKTLEALVAEERQKQHHVLADRLAEYLKTNGNYETKNLATLDERTSNLLYEISPQRTLGDLLLPNNVVSACNELIEEHQRCDLLRSYNLEPRNRILLAGPPGNGKTSLAEALADGLMIPLFVVRYEGIIGSYLGETAVRLKRLFDHVCTRFCVLFFDEFDTLGKERGDIHETGEIKRVVSSLLLQIDALPSHVIVVTATNHPELLDRAVWRRFQLRLLIPPPTQERIEEWLSKFEKRLNEPLNYSSKKLAEELKGLSFAEIEEFGISIMRRWVLSIPNGNLNQIISEQLKQLQARFELSSQDKANLL